MVKKKATMDYRDSYTEESIWYDVMQVCENGHKITAYGKSRPEYLVDRCTKCGAQTITKCKNCGAEIQGYRHHPSVVEMDSSVPPEFCHKCGEPFPWTGKNLLSASNFQPISKIEKILKRFHIVARQLRDRHSNRPTIDIDDEYDVQDLLHALLKIEFDDIRPEEWTASYAGSCSRMDFLLKSEKIVIETKKTKKGLDAKEIGEQLLIDIAKYQTHSDCKTLICFIYDPEGKIGNPKGLKNDLERLSSANLKIIVYISP